LDERKDQLDRRGVADAIEPALGPRLIATAAQLGEPAGLYRVIDAGLIISGSEVDIPIDNASTDPFGNIVHRSAILPAQSTISPSSLHTRLFHVLWNLPSSHSLARPKFLL
jgi:hypothetical protein